jgi:antitoxin YefM
MLRTGNLYNKHRGLTLDTTYTQLREKLASVLDRVSSDQEVFIVRRRGAKDVALIPADELAAIMETAHLLRSPKNASRLLRAFRRAEKKSGKPEPLDKLRREMKLEPVR